MEGIAQSTNLNLEKTAVQFLDPFFLGYNLQLARGFYFKTAFTTEHVKAPVPAFRHNRLFWNVNEEMITWKQVKAKPVMWASEVKLRQIWASPKRKGKKQDLNQGLSVKNAEHHRFKKVAGI